MADSRAELSAARLARAERAYARSVLADAKAVVAYQRALAAGTLPKPRTDDLSGLHIVRMPEMEGRARAANRPTDTPNARRSRRQDRAAMTARVDSMPDGTAKRFGRFLIRTHLI